MRDVALLITCEHAVNAVPERWQSLFRGNSEILESHRGWDPGAAELSRELAGELSAPCFMARVSRLLLDHNRSPHNRSLWSEFSRDLPPSDKTLLLGEFYQPFRDQAGRWIAARHASGDRVIHLSTHSFTPVLDDKVRAVDVGLLYDTGRPDEVCFAGLQAKSADDSERCQVSAEQEYAVRDGAVYENAFLCECRGNRPDDRHH